MARRLSFSVAVVLIAVAVVGSSVAWVFGDEVPGWLAQVAMFGGAAFVLAITLALKDLLRGIWSASRERKNQITKLGELKSMIEELRRQVAERDSTISIQTAAIWNSIEKLERVQVDEVGSTLRRIEGFQSEGVSRAGAVRGRLKDIGDALGRIEGVQAEQVTRVRKVRGRLQDIQLEQDVGYRQVESHITLMTTMNLRAPLPPMRRTWAIAPDAGAFLVQTIIGHNVQSVLELGSGSSTVLVARALQRTGAHHFTSLEQDPDFLAKTLGLLRSEGMEEFVNLVQAPLTETGLGELDWRWYDDAALEGMENLDLVIVDGPPSRTGSLARYPALPMVASRLNGGALIFLDDANRDDEIEVVRRWIVEFPVIALDTPETENGVALLQWQP